MAGHRYVTADGNDPQENNWLGPLLVVGGVVLGITALYYWRGQKKELDAPVSVEGLHRPHLPIR